MNDSTIRSSLEEPDEMYIMLPDGTECAFIDLEGDPVIELNTKNFGSFTFIIRDETTSVLLNLWVKENLPSTKELIAHLVSDKLLRDEAEAIAALDLSVRFGGDPRQN